MLVNWSDDIGCNIRMNRSTLGLRLRLELHTWVGLVLLVIKA
jgi:hypothetical protein